jgi:hypothetical protein
MQRLIFVISLIVLAAVQTAHGQTSTFTYQGRLTEGGNPASGAYQMQFKLFDSLAGPTQIGSTLADVPVTVAQGVFTVNLDFGIVALSGADRWIEIAVRHNSGEVYTTLSPREQITSSPYAVRTISAGLADNALALGGLAASEYVTTASVGNAFVKNTTSPQAANFNITGDGIVGGSVGIGTPTPAQRLHIQSPAGVNAASLVQAPVGFFAQYQVQSGADNPWIIGAQDNFSNGALLLRSGFGDVMALRQTGNVGIGTNSPAARLHINGAAATGLSLLATDSVSIGGHISQSRDQGGIVKAMAYVNGDGTLSRCYNGVTGSSSGNCGLTVSRAPPPLDLPGTYRVDFNFPVNDRFLAITVQNSNVGAENAGASYVFSGSSANAILVFTYAVDSGASDRPFMVILY